MPLGDGDEAAADTERMLLALRLPPGGRGAEEAARVPTRPRAASRWKSASTTWNSSGRSWNWRSWLPEEQYEAAKAVLLSDRRRTGADREGNAVVPRDGAGCPEEAAHDARRHHDRRGSRRRRDRARRGQDRRLRADDGRAARGARRTRPGRAGGVRVRGRVDLREPDAVRAEARTSPSTRERSKPTRRSAPRPGPT